MKEFTVTEQAVETWCFIYRFKAKSAADAKRLVEEGKVHHRDKEYLGMESVRVDVQKKGIL